MPNTENRLERGANHIYLEKIEVPGIPGLKMWGNKLYANKHVLVTSTFNDGSYGEERYIFNEDGILVHTDFNNVIESIEVHFYRDAESGVSSVIISKIEDGETDRPYGVSRAYSRDGLLMTAEGATIDIDLESGEQPRKLTEWYHENTYDIETDRLVSTMRLTGPNGVGTRSYYHYNDEGKLIRDELYSIIDFKDVSISQVTTYSYAQDGSYIVECIDGTDGEILFREYYDSDGRPFQFNSDFERMTAEYDVINGRNVMRHSLLVTEEKYEQETTFEFDEFGNVTMMADAYKTPDDEGNIIETELVTEYLYDENHNIIFAKDNTGKEITVAYEVTSIEDMLEELDMEDDLILN